MVVECGAVGWGDPGTRRRWKRQVVLASLGVVVGTLAFVGFTSYVVMTANHAETLVDTGVRTTGLVLRDPPSTIRCSQVRVPIRFRVGTQDEVHNYGVSGCGGGGLRAGMRVIVHFDPTNPADFVVNGDANESGPAVLAAVVALVGAVFLVPIGVVGLARLGRIRRVLRRYPWERASVTPCVLSSAWVRGRTALRLDYGGSSSTLELDLSVWGAPTLVAVADRWGVPNAVVDWTLDVAGGPDRYVVRSAATGRLLGARPIRPGARATKAAALLDRFDATRSLR